MAQTVREVIRMLKRFPPEAIVGWQDHDQSDNELNALVRVAREASPAQVRKYVAGVVLAP